MARATIERIFLWQIISDANHEQEYAVLSVPNTVWEIVGPAGPSRTNKLMHYKKKHNRTTLARKKMPETNSIGEWSRMLHKSWMIDVHLKQAFRKKNYDSE